MLFPYCLDSNHPLVRGKCDARQAHSLVHSIGYVQEDSQWSAEGEYTASGYATWEQRLGSTECINRTVFVGALHGMMTAFALARISQELFGDVEYAAIDTDRNKYPIGRLSRTCRDSNACTLLRQGSGRVVFVNAHSYYAAVTANYLMIDCDKFCKVVCIPRSRVSSSRVHQRHFYLDSNRSVSIRQRSMRWNCQCAMVSEHGPVLLPFAEVHEILLCDVLGSQSEPSGHAKQRMRTAGDDPQAVDAQCSERVRVTRVRACR